MESKSDRTQSMIADFEKKTYVNRNGEIKPITERTFVTKNGKVREDKLKPEIFHDNRSGGQYVYGKNASKRAKKALKSK